jgi:hypothetical protein
LLSVLRFLAFPGTFTVLRRRFPLKTSRGLRLVQLCTLNFTSLRTLSAFFPAGRAIHSRNLRSVCASSASNLPELLLTVLPSGFLSRSPCGFRSGILLHGFLSDSLSEWLHQVGRPINLSINKHPESICPYGLSLARDDFLQKYSGTYEPFYFRLFATTLKRTLSTFWLSG